MKAYVFPGQGSQFPGMGKELWDSSEQARAIFRRSDEILGFSITDIMFNGDEEALKATDVTQPAVFIHSVAAALCAGAAPEMAAGHSLGEFSALTVAGALDFEDALKLVSLRAKAMQQCCEAVPGTMAAVVGGDINVISEICRETEGIVIPANFNSAAQVVISGEIEAVAAAGAAIKERKAGRVLPLKVGGAFHSPLMEPAREELAAAIADTEFKTPSCPVYQNVDALPHTAPEAIKANLLMQLTSPVLWTQTVLRMVEDGADEFIEAGPGSVLRGLIKKTVPDVLLSGL